MRGVERARLHRGKRGGARARLARRRHRTRGARRRRRIAERAQRARGLMFAHAREMALLPLARLHDQTDAVHRPQRDRRAELDRVAGQRVQIEVLRDHRDEHAHLQERGLKADALAHPAAEREIDEAVARRRVAREVLRVERVRIAPERRMAMRDVRRHEDRRTRRNPVAADLVVLDEIAREAPDRRIDAQHLVDDLRQIRQLFEVLHGGRTAAEARVELVAQLAQHGRMLRERVQRPREARARRLVPREEHGHHFVVHFLLRHRRAGVRIARVQQQRDHVARLAARFAVIGDDLRDDRVDRAARVRDPAIEARRRPARNEVVQVALRHHRLDPEAHRRPRCLRVRRHVGVEHHQPEHPEAQVHHLFDDVERLAGRQRAPAIRERERRVADGGRVRIDLLLVKERLHDAPVAPPEFAVGRQQAVAEEHLEVVVETPAHVVAVVLLQHVLNVIRMRERVRDERAEPVARDVAVLLMQPQQHRDRIALVCGEVAHHEAAARPRRLAVLAHAVSRSVARRAASASTSAFVAYAPVVRCT
ncbi:cytochrome P450 family domain protein [Burkholderia mallei]|nr:cytochrome P450 family domain protein [Burkholderia mallei]KOT11527.1 cytochrome P450 family domain protein [Burkholderia mallei]